MKHGITIQIVLLALAIIAVVGCGSDVPDDGLVEDLGSLMPGEPVVPEVAETAPDHVTVLFADDLVHVSRIILRSGETIPELEAGHHRLYFPPRGTAELAVEEGAHDSLIQLRSGELEYIEPGAVTITNVGSLPIVLVEVARTAVMLPEFLDSRIPQAESDHPPIFENDRVRVHELTLEPGAMAELLPAPIRVVYPMADSTLEYRKAGGETVTIPGGPSTSYSRPGDDISVTNLGDETVDLMIFDWLM